MIGVFDFLERVIVICSKHLGSVSSWGRTPHRNKLVGGAEGSLHMVWLACDVVLDDMKKNIEFEKDCKRLGILAIFEKDHYHLQPIA